MRELYEHLDQCGYTGRVVGIEHVRGLKRELEGLGSSGSVAESRDVSREEMQACLTDFLSERGYQVRRAYLPDKMLVARSGLARYGKNNITYIPESGSFHRPAAFYSDLPAPGLPLGEHQMLDMCRNCVACARACPTGAIAQDRFLLRAERCITFLNELPGEFPGWVDPAWHNCVNGCMRCQLACPADRGVWDWAEERDGFDEEETGLILEGAVLDDLPPETRAKLGRLHLDHHIDVLPRNLGVLVLQTKQGSQA